VTLLARLTLTLVLALSLAAQPLGAMADPAPRPVRVEPVVLVPRATSLAYSGTVQARHLTDMGFRVAGKIVTRPVDLGQVVHQGDVLATLDPTDFRLNQEAAESTQAAAEADARNAAMELARYQGLGRNSPAFLPSEFDNRQAASLMATARLAQAQRQTNLARQQLEYTILRADADGIVTAMPADLGQVVAAGAPVVTLARDGELDVVVDVPENRLPEIRGAARVDVNLWAAPDRVLPARVREIGGSADPASRTYTVKVGLIDPPRSLVALGMTATVRFTAPDKGEVVLLPASALTRLDGKPAVWVLDPKRQLAAARPVSLVGLGGDGMAAIAGGLREGELVVTAGASAIDAATPVVAWAGAEH
jgi:membrane fusion protein, multidrug efflux system